MIPCGNAGRRICLGGALLALVLTGCPGQPGSASARVWTDQQAPDFTLEDLEGRTVSFAEARRDKVVLLKFGALWCGWCNRQADEFVRLQPHLNADETVLLEVSVKSDLPAEEVRARHESLGLKHTILRDPTGEVGHLYGVRYLPSLFIVDRRGVVVWSGGYTKADELADLLRKAAQTR
jgi:peroxiredoxin